ncbi:MAG: autotransporter family protein [Parachlamydiaceae bacterium]
MVFQDHSTGGEAVIYNDEQLYFKGFSSMKQAEIMNRFQLVLRGHASGDHAKIHNEGEFRLHDYATADHAEMTNHNRMYVYDKASFGNSKTHNFGDCYVYGNANFGNAYIVNDQQLEIFQEANAGNATIINDYFLAFKGNSCAGTAKIENNHAFYLSENTKASNATVINAQGAYIDIAEVCGEGISIGSLDGAGNLFLGSKNLTLGGLGNDNTISGTIQDGTYVLNKAQVRPHEKGSITKIGRGTLIFAGKTSYSGDTFIQEGRLRAGNTCTWSPYSAYHVFLNATLDLNGHSQRIRYLTNDGHVDFGWNPNESTQFTVTDELNCAVGSFCMHTDLASKRSDRLIVEGPSAGNYVVHIVNHSSLPDDPELNLELISTSDGNASFKLQGESVDVGAFAYTLERKATSWFLKNTRLNHLTAAVVSVARSIPFAWFEEGSTLIERMGELRLQTANDCLRGGSWFRSFGQKAYVDKDQKAPKFHCTQYGMQAGLDKIWSLNAENRLYLGGFAGYSHLEDSFHKNHSSGHVRSHFGGIYLTWINDPGWYVDAIIKANYFSTDFKAKHSQNVKLTGNYHAWGAGFSVEGGRRFSFLSGYSLEPQLQLSYLHLNGTSFDAHYFDANLCDSDVMQLREGLLMAYQIEACGYGEVEFYGRVSLVQQWSSGGRLVGGNLRYRPNLDGTYVDFNGGIAIQMQDQLQLHLNYEASIGKHYSKPWGLNANLRYEF